MATNGQSVAANVNQVDLRAAKVLRFGGSWPGPRQCAAGSCRFWPRLP